MEIANELLEAGTAEGVAIATGLKRARLFLQNEQASPKGSRPKIKNVKSKDKRAATAGKSASKNKLYVEAFHDYDDFMLKKRQYAKAVHIFHDQTAQFNEKIDDLPVKEIEAQQKVFLQHERDFHDVMDSFDRALHAYNVTLNQLKDLSEPVQFSVAKKRYEMRFLSGELQVKAI